MQRTLIKDTLEKIGEIVMIEGWVDTKRDHGKLTFIDLRDRTGILQCVGFQKMGELTPESVMRLTGTIKKRPEKMVNADIPTGTVEMDVTEYEVLGTAGELPITVQGDGIDINEEHRLRYRYLDMRRTRMAHIMRLRSKYFHELRQELVKHEFCEVETPILSKATMEGARDFLVPSRFQAGKFYALPQSPQQYKQLLMVGGIERYFQFARCFRDEDLRSDRGFEFTQLDLEMSFVTRDDVMQTVEFVVKESVKAVGGKLQAETFPIVDYKEALEKYGADKFDLRTEEEKTDGILGFAWVVNFPMFKKVDTADAAEVRDGRSGWTFTHNPFSAAKQEHEDWLISGEHIGEIMTDQYDLVCNGYEVDGPISRYKDVGVDSTIIDSSSSIAEALPILRDFKASHPQETETPSRHEESQLTKEVGNHRGEIVFLAEGEIQRQDKTILESRLKEVRAKMEKTISDQTNSIHEYRIPKEIRKFSTSDTHTGDGGLPHFLWEEPRAVSILANKQARKMAHQEHLATSD